MPRLNIIILDQSNVQANDYRVAFWADVPAARQTYYAAASLTSAWRGATATDNSNLQTGLVTEVVMSIRLPQGTTLPQIQSALQAQWQQIQTFVSNNNPWIRYGSTWDGTTWVVQTGG